MRFYRTLAYASVSLLSLASAPAFAQGAQPGEDSALGEDGGEIIVQARRRDESAQDVPLVVNAVTSESLAKLNIRDFQDVQNVVPGLQLQPAPNGVQPQVTLRGINNDVTAAGNNGTVQFYQNDAPISPAVLLTSMFDVGQIEVLRGPQGTLRGRAAPSGSITVTTRRPDLDEVGGYVNMTGQTHGAINVNGAIGLPVIKDVLAVRVAALYDQNSASRLSSLNNGVQPRAETHGERISVRFDPVDSLTFNASFTNVVRNVRDFGQIESMNFADPTAAASPVSISPGDRLSLMQTPNTLHSHFQTWNWQGDWRFSGQRLVYVGSYAKEQFTAFAPTDSGGLFTGFPDAARLAGQTTITQQTEESHELRLQSDDRVAGMFDYILGGFIYKTSPNTTLALPTIVFQGIFQNPATFVPTGANFAQTAYTAVLRNSNAIERSVFANLTAHFGEQTELSGGVRYISYRSTDSTVVAAAGLNTSQSNSENRWIYTASLKHRFNDNFMAYASVGSSWRPGSTTNGIIDTNAAPSPVERQLQLNQPSETSTSYEIGFKSDFFDRRVRLNVSAFQQDFNNYITSFPNIYVAYIDPSNGTQRANLLSSLSVGVPARVRGVEAEIDFKATDRWTLGASVTYANSKIKNAVVPCNNFPGATPTYASIVAANNGETIGTCQVNYSASRTAPFSAVVQSEYMAPISQSVDGFVRGLVNFSGKSKGDPANAFDDVDAYALVNLYTGIRDPKGAWEVSLFAKNLFNVERVLTRSANASGVGYTQLTCSSQVPQCGGATTREGGNLFSTYRGITMTQPREFGLNVRYAFGSR